MRLRAWLNSDLKVSWSRSDFDFQTIMCEPVLFDHITFFVPKNYIYYNRSVNLVIWSGITKLLNRNNSETNTKLIYEQYLLLDRGEWFHGK